MIPENYIPKLGDKFSWTAEYLGEPISGFMKIVALSLDGEVFTMYSKEWEDLRIGHNGSKHTKENGCWDSRVNLMREGYAPYMTCNYSLIPRIKIRF